MIRIQPRISRRQVSALALGLLASTVKGVGQGGGTVFANPAAQDAPPGGDTSERPVVAVRPFPFALIRRTGQPIIEPKRARVNKDATILREDDGWSVFGSGGNPSIFWLQSPSLDGPWIERESPGLMGDPPSASGIVPVYQAPGLIYASSTGTRHLYIQRTFFIPGENIEHFVSLPGSDGTLFHWKRTAVTCRPGTPEAGIYDAGPAVIKGRKVLTYAGFQSAGYTNLYIGFFAGNDWEGELDRKLLLAADQIPFQMKPGPGYEWGPEAPRLFEFPDGDIYLMGACFKDGPPRTRQRVFWARFDGSGFFEDPAGSIVEIYEPPLDPAFDSPAGSGENGHGDAWIVDGRNGPELRVVYQARPVGGGSWRLLSAIYDLSRAETFWGAARKMTRGIGRKTA